MSGFPARCKRNGPGTACLTPLSSRSGSPFDKILRQIAHAAFGLTHNMPKNFPVGIPIVGADPSRGIGFQLFQQPEPLCTWTKAGNSILSAVCCAAVPGRKIVLPELCLPGKSPGRRIPVLPPLFTGFLMALCTACHLAQRHDKQRRIRPHKHSPDKSPDQSPFPLSCSARRNKNSRRALPIIPHSAFTFCHITMPAANDSV